MKTLNGLQDAGIPNTDIMYSGTPTVYPDVTVPTSGYIPMAMAPTIFGMPQKQFLLLLAAVAVAYLVIKKSK